MPIRANSEEKSHGVLIGENVFHLKTFSCTFLFFSFFSPCPLALCSLAFLFWHSPSFFFPSPPSLTPSLPPSLSHSLTPSHTVKLFSADSFSLPLLLPSASFWLACFSLSLSLPLSPSHTPTLSLALSLLTVHHSDCRFLVLFPLSLRVSLAFLLGKFYFPVMSASRLCFQQIFSQPSLNRTIEYVNSLFR